MDTVAAWGTVRPPLLERIALEAIRRRILRGPFKAPVRRFLKRSRSAWDIDVNGVNIRCHYADNFTEQRLAEGRNRDDLANIERLVAKIPEGGVFVDVGANCGLYSMFAARRVGPAGTVIAIEPVPEMQRRVRTNVAVNGFANVHLFPVAAGAEAGEIALRVDDTQFGASSAAGTSGRKIVVPVRTLTDILAEAGVTRIDALKIDVEGYEDRALVPFLQSAPAALWPAHILIETLHADRWASDLLGEAAGRGYTTAWKSDADVILSRVAA